MFLSIILISLHVQVAFWQLLINEHDDDDDARTARGGVPATPNFGGSSMYAYTLSLNYQIWRGNTCGDGGFLEINRIPTTRGGTPALHKLFCFRIHYFTHEYQIWGGNTYAEGA